MRTLRLWAGVAILATTVVGTGTGADARTTKTEPPFSVQGSVEQVAVTGAPAGTKLQLINAQGKVAERGTADAAGSLLFRNITRHGKYRVQAAGAKVPCGSKCARRSGASSANAVTVVAPRAAPPADLYTKQHLGEGFQYVETRDGTTLSIMVRLPGPIDQGPYPTVVEYSGYAASDPDAPQPTMILASLLGYATVGVNVRGTGCSGGAFNFFETLQNLDGYDAIETIAAQPWVQDHEVGMVGVSYPGITQLFVAATQPPSLVAITPLSVLDDVYNATLYPGGIFNNGFAKEWAEERQAAAKPGGYDFVQKRMDAGDQQCVDNQKLRGQTPDLLKEIAKNKYYDPAVADALAPITFVNKINVPLFLASAWQDEQTGGHFAAMLDKFTGAPVKRFTVYNGEHGDSLGPELITRWAEFLDFYVAKKTPAIPAATKAAAPVLFDAIFGSPDAKLPDDRFGGYASFDEAKKAYEAEPDVRVLFESGGKPGTPGQPLPGFEETFSKWPVPGIDATSYYLQPDAGLSTTKPKSNGGADQYTYDATVGDKTTLPAGIATEVEWGPKPPYDWQPQSDQVSYETAPLTENTVIIGPSSADLWVKSNAKDTDLQVTITEIRPDGNEVYVQAGWLRASERKLDAKKSTSLRPVATHHKADVQSLPEGTFSLARVEMFPVAYAFREGSKIRVTVDAPGGERPRWKFDSLQPTTPTKNQIGHSAAYPSRMVLPVVPGIDVPTPLPPCPSLRGEPCRTAPAIDNQAVN